MIEQGKGQGGGRKGARKVEYRGRQGVFIFMMMVVPAMAMELLLTLSHSTSDTRAVSSFSTR